MAQLSQDEILRAAFKYQDALTSYAFSLLRDWALAQDVVQESYLVLLRKWQDFQPETNLYAWVRQIVRFEALNVLRSRKTERPLVFAELEALVDRRFEAQLREPEALRMNEERKALHECMAGMQQEALDILLGFYRDRCSSEELASRYRRSIKGIRLFLSRLRKKWRMCVPSRMALREG